MDVKHVAKLANLPLKSEDEKKLQSQFEQTLATVGVLNRLDTTGIDATSQVTGLTSVLREDIIDTARIIPQSQVLAGSKHTYNGYFVVPFVFEQ